MLLNKIPPSANPDTSNLHNAHETTNAVDPHSLIRKIIFVVVINPLFFSKLSWNLLFLSSRVSQGKPAAAYEILASILSHPLL